MRNVVHILNILNTQGMLHLIKYFVFYLNIIQTSLYFEIQI